MKNLLFLGADPVQNVSVSTQGPDSLLVSWIPADSADDNIAHYVFTVTDKDDSNRCIRTVIISIGESLEMPVRITNLSLIVHNRN